MKKKSRVSGQSAVEFALVLPLILLIIIVFIDLARITYYHSALTNAVREGARYGVVTCISTTDTKCKATTTAWSDAIKQKVTDYSLAMPLQKSEVTVVCYNETTVTTPPHTHALPCNQTGDSVAVTAQTQIDPMAVFTAWIIGGGNQFDIKAESTMLMTPYGIY